MCSKREHRQLRARTWRLRHCIVKFSLGGFTAVLRRFGSLRETSFTSCHHTSPQCPTQSPSTWMLHATPAVVQLSSPLSSSRIVRVMLSSWSSPLSLSSSSKFTSRIVYCNHRHGHVYHWIHARRAHAQKASRTSCSYANWLSRSVSLSRSFRLGFVLVPLPSLTHVIVVIVIPPGRRHHTPSA